MNTATHARSLGRTRQPNKADAVTSSRVATMAEVKQALARIDREFPTAMRNLAK